MICSYQILLLAAIGAVAVVAPPPPVWQNPYAVAANDGSGEEVLTAPEAPPPQPEPEPEPATPEPATPETRTKAPVTAILPRVARRQRLLEQRAADAAATTEPSSPTTIKMDPFLALICKIAPKLNPKCPTTTTSTTSTTTAASTTTTTTTTQKPLLQADADGQLEATTPKPKPFQHLLDILSGKRPLFPNAKTLNARTQ